MFFITASWVTFMLPLCFLVLHMHMPWNSPGYDCSYNANIDWIILNININFKLTMMYYINGFLNTLTQLMNYKK